MWFYLTETVFHFFTVNRSMLPTWSASHKTVRVIPRLHYSSPYGALPLISENPPNIRQKYSYWHILLKQNIFSFCPSKDSSSFCTEALKGKWEFFKFPEYCLGVGCRLREERAGYAGGAQAFPSSPRDQVKPLHFLVGSCCFFLF